MYVLYALFLFQISGLCSFRKFTEMFRSIFIHTQSPLDFLAKYVILLCDQLIKYEILLSLINKIHAFLRLKYILIYQLIDEFYTILTDDHNEIHSIP